MSTLDERSNRNLQGVHPDLVRIVRACANACPIAFTVTEGVRTLERQRKLVESGASKTMNSRHISGHAVDIAAMVDLDGDGKLEIRWDWPLYAKIANSMKAAAKVLALPIEWGGDWRTFKDGPHFQLPHEAYPNDPATA